MIQPIQGLDMMGSIFAMTILCAFVTGITFGFELAWGRGWQCGYEDGRADGRRLRKSSSASG